HGVLFLLLETLISRGRYIHNKRLSIRASTADFVESPFEFSARVMLEFRDCAILTSVCAVKSEDVETAKTNSKSPWELANSVCPPFDTSAGSGNTLRHNPRQARNRDCVRREESLLFAR